MVGPLAPEGEKAVGAAFSRDGARAVIGFEDSTVRLVDAITGEPRATVRPHATAAFTFAFAPDDQTIACGSDDRTLSLLDAATLAVQRRVRGFGDRVRAAAWSSDGRRVAGVDIAGFVVVAPADMDAPPIVIDAGDVGPLDDVEFLAGDQEVRVAGPRGVATFGAEGPETLHVVRAHAGVAEGNPTPYVYAVTTDPTGRRFASGGWDGTVRVHDARTTALLATIRCPAPVYATRFDPTGARLAIACVGGTLWIASADGAILARREGLHRLHVQPLAWAPDGRGLLALDGERRIVEVEATTLATTRTYAATEATPIGVAVSPDGTRVAILDDAGSLHVRTRDGGAGATTRAHEGQGSSVAWSRDGRRLVTTGADGIVRVADARGAEVRRLRGHEGTVYAARFLTDDRIVSGGNDATLRVWDLAAGEEVVVLDGHEAYVFDLAVTPDGETVLSASGDNTVRLWSATPFAERRRRALPEAASEGR